MIRTGYLLKSRPSRRVPRDFASHESLRYAPNDETLRGLSECHTVRPGWAHVFGGRPSGPRIRGNFSVSFLSQLAPTSV
jgi:hypothetical protein